MNTYFHSVTLDKDLCRGCTNCIKRCPTEAIRVRNGKARIIKERCIDCGECIKVCPYRAKKAVTDNLSSINKYKYKIALPAPSLYVQFKNKPDINLILNGLKKIGFDEVFEVARAAELVTLATKKYIAENNVQKPVISSACPAVTRLIKVKFPNLIDNILPLLAPIEIAAKLSLEEAISKTNLPSEDIGVFFITPCAAKVTCSYSPIGVSESKVSGCIPINEIYKALLPVMKNIKDPELIASAGIEGVKWAKNSGESIGLKTENYIAVDGIHDVIKIFEQIDAGFLNDIDFVEASSCVGGCIGGPLTVENPFVAKTKLNSVLDNTKLVPSKVDFTKEIEDAVKWTCPVEFNAVMKLDENMEVALRMLTEIEELYNDLPQIDCGSCGSPSCHAMAEDIVKGYAKKTDCIFKLKEKLKHLAE
ncbi:MAG: 4Fe-4S dicluster domain-containing protein [Clostridia bacterium]|nr:4Fe-4S dicluster domain-containing protein [Clostridia bacterium]MBQ4542856.1 4Fe-4S dicluster domain-containing protein [Clostridia bacterium]